MRFSQVNRVRIPKGYANRIRHNGKVLWNEPIPDPYLARYVSLGDSIAAGHAINGEWEKNYGNESQYWYKISEGNYRTDPTVVVPDSYTDLIHAELERMYGGRVSATSFAQSGDEVHHLMEKLDHTVVRNAIAKANYVTVCIGANDVLQPALMNLDQYVNSGDLSGITAIVNANLAKLADDSNANSYKALFDKLIGINPNAKYVFTTIYNPYKYLWLEESTRENNYKDGFLGPLMWCIPDSLGDSMANTFRNAFLNTDAVEMLFDRINGIDGWTETQVTALNNVLRSKISAYGNANLLLADTKAVFDYVPDRPVNAPKHYNDLVNVEPTRGYVVQDLDWSQFWTNVNWANALSSVDSIASEVMDTILNHVILPDIDPHPEEYGHYAMQCAFADALGWSTLTRHTISFNANGGTGAMSSQVVTALDGMSAYVAMSDSTFAVPNSSQRFAGWNTASDGSGTAYAKGQVVGITSDITLYAQWSGTCRVTVSHSMGDVLPNYGSGDTGPMGNYAYLINGVEQADLGAFSNSARVHELPVGTVIAVAVNEESGSKRSYITLNGANVPYIEGISFPAYQFTLTRDVNIHFEWNCWMEGLSYQSYWNCYITTK